MKINDFELVSSLGKGAYGEVVHAVHNTTKKKYAIKIMSKRFMIKTKKTLAVFREKEILRFVKNIPYAVQLRASFQDQRNIYILMELVDGVTLLEYVEENGKLSSSLVHHIAKQIIHFLLEIKKLGITHGDIKPGNVMVLEDYSIKIIDFGCAGIYEENELNSALHRKFELFKEKNSIITPASEFNGTYSFLSPEYLETSKPQWSNDVWALGVLTYYLLTAELPFDAGSDYLISLKIARNDYEIPEGLTELEESFIESILIKEESRRLGITRAEDLLEHDYAAQKFSWIDPFPVVSRKPSLLRVCNIDATLKFTNGITQKIEPKDKVLLEDTYIATKWLIFPEVKLAQIVSGGELILMDEDKMSIHQTIPISEMRKIKKLSPTKLQITLCNRKVLVFEFMNTEPNDWIDIIVEKRKVRRTR